MPNSGLSGYFTLSGEMMCGWMSITLLTTVRFSSLNLVRMHGASRRLRINKQLRDGYPSERKALFEGVALKRLDGRLVGRHTKGQRVWANDAGQVAILLVSRGRSLTRGEIGEPFSLGGGVSLEQRPCHPRVRLQDAVLDYDRAVHRVDAGLLVPRRLELLGVRKEVGIVGWRDLLGVPSFGRLARASKAGIAREARADLTLGHHLDQRGAFRRLYDIGRQLQRLHMLLIVDHPGHLRTVEPVVVDQDATGPHPRGHRIGAHSNFLAFEVLRIADVGVRAHQQSTMMKAARDKDRQSNERPTERTGHDVGCRGNLANVEFDVADHAPIGGDLRLNLDEIGSNPLDRDAARKDGPCVGVVGNSEIQ